MFAESLIGRQIGGFLIHAVLGRGGMGIVFRAEAQDGSMVALKLLAPELSRDDELRERFIREAEVSLDHPNILPTYSAGLDGDNLFLTMKLVDGPDLKVALTKKGRMRPSRVVRIFEQAAAALDAAHENGVVHRDVKPQNFLLEPAGADEHLYLSDFGLVKTVSSGTSLTASAHLIGTAQYMSPEQIRNRPIDGRSDVYSLGCVLFECLTGAVPFAGREEVAVLFSHVNDPAPSAVAEVPTLPDAIDAVVAKAMAKEPSDRYLTAGDMAAELDQILSPAPVRRRTWSPVAVKPLSSAPQQRLPVAPQPATVGRSYTGWFVAAAVSAIALFGYAGGREAAPRPVVAASDQQEKPQVLPEATFRETPAKRKPAKKEASNQAPRGRLGEKRTEAFISALEEPPGEALEVAPVESAQAPVPQPDPGRYFFDQRGHEALCPVDAGCVEGYDLSSVQELVVIPTSSGEPHGYVEAARYSPRLLVRKHIVQRADKTLLREMLMTFDTSEGSFSVRLRPGSGSDLLRFPLRPGHSWTGAWTNSPTSGTYKVSVLAHDKTRLGPRVFRTVRVRSTFTWDGTHRGRMEVTSWIDPRTRLALESVGVLEARTGNEDHFYKITFQQALDQGPGYR